MSWFSKKKEPESVVKPRSYTVKTTVSKVPQKYSSTDYYQVTVEGSGFTGTATELFLSTVFQKAYEDLMQKVSEAIFQDND